MDARCAELDEVASVQSRPSRLIEPAGLVQAIANRFVFGSIKSATRDALVMHWRATTEQRATILARPGKS